ncbi:hypothetical protein LTR85_007995 [Meristemomyces frigidus]|nr:hypothetical protein LTR85_007995 [Meristemomyces frigidus]
MALRVSNATPAHVNGIRAPSPAEDEELYTQLLRLQDVVIAGKHPVFRLPQSVIEQLKAALVVPETPAAMNGSAFATNQQQLQSPHAKVNGLPGLHAPAIPATNGAKSAYAAKAAGLDPIFLQKSDSLVRAEGQLKRQRIERDLQMQVEQRKHSSRDRDPGADGPSRIDMDAVLNAALARVPPVSGLKPTKPASMSSFDENDYYSSQAPSDWSSDASPSKGSDKGTGALTADFERVGAAANASNPFAESSRYAQKRAMPGSSLSHASKDRPHFYTNEPEDAYNVEDEDDEYTPPDAAAFDSLRGEGTDLQHHSPEDDNSDYEPDEITHESAMPSPYHQTARAALPSPRVPVIRNHLTHIAAPQPNRVSPLATAKGPRIELELVNGRPEIVQKSQPQHRSVPMHSRASTASPSGNGAGGSGKKRRTKKRKRDHMHEQNKPAKKGRRERQAARAMSPAQQEPYIKDEPISPPPFANVPEAPVYGQPQYRQAPAQVDLASPGQPPQVQYVNEPPRSGLRYEYAQPSSPAGVRVASPGGHRPIQRDTQDLRRVASLHYAQRPPSPTQRIYSPAGQYRAASAAYGEQRPLQLAPATEPVEAPRYREVPAQSEVQYVRAPTPPRIQEYQEAYTRAQSPVVMAPPPPRRIVVDQFGNRYYAAESAPAPSRASVAPVERLIEPQPQSMYERAPSRMSVAYAPPPQAAPYEPMDTRMAPPPPRRQEQPIEYVDANGYRVAREYSTRPAEPVRYAEAPTSPIYQQAPRYEPMPAPPAPGERTSPVYQPAPRYEQMPPPPPPHVQPLREPTSPVYQQMPRAYSVRPEEPPQQAPSYMRQASVAPQYVRQEMAPPPPPAREVSVMPGADYGAQVQQPAYSYAPAPQAVKYVDQYGREVYPQQVRQVSEFRYQ